MFRTTLVAALLASAPAFAGPQITFGPSTQDVTFTGISGSISVTAPQLDFNSTAFDTTNPGLGSAWILGLDVATGPEVGGIFPANPNSETFKYTASDGDYLVETIHVTGIQDDTTQPKVFFVGDPPTTITGDASFVAAFSGPDEGDWIMNDLGVTLTALVGSAGATISAGEKLPSPSPVGEPATLALLGGLLVAFGLARRGWRGRLDPAV